MEPSTLLSPVPVVLVSCRGRTGPLDRNNLITLAWAGTINSEPPMLSISVRKSRLSHPMIRETGEFVVNLVDEDLVDACDFCGVRSGRDLDKFDACRLTAIPSRLLDHAPTLAESPLSLECRVDQVIELPSHDLFLARIVAVTHRADLMDPSGRLALHRARLVAYLHGEYWNLSRCLGFFGYSVAAPPVLKRRMRTIRERDRD